jgi:hypothetical protein
LPRNPQKPSGPIKQELMAAFDVAKVRGANLTIPELEQPRTALLNTLAFAHLRRSHQYAIERYFGTLILS